jgi:hypothetical protein
MCTGCIERVQRLAHQTPGGYDRLVQPAPQMKNSERATTSALTWIAFSVLFTGFALLSLNPGASFLLLVPACVTAAVGVARSTGRQRIVAWLVLAGIAALAVLRFNAYSRHMADYETRRTG